MSAPIRVMIVDDSSVVRRLLTQALARFEEIEVVGSAVNGVMALAKLAQLAPEVVILDIEMPEMDGITTLTHLRQSHPRLPVIMFSTLTERGASVTFDALAAGASDYVLKPSTQAGETLDSVVSTALAPKIIALARSRFGAALQAAIVASSEVTMPQPRLQSTQGVGTSIAPKAPPQALVQRPLANTFAPRPPPTLAGGRPSLPAQAARPSMPSPVKPSVRNSSMDLLAQVGPFTDTPSGSSALLRGSVPEANKLVLQVPAAAGAGPSRARKTVQVIAIASSTGGPNALAEILPRLPGELPVPILIVQHMPPIFTRCLAERLAQRCELKLTESGGRERVAPGHVYIAPGNHHLEVVRDLDGSVSTLLSDGPAENSCRPAADVLFRSVAKVYGNAALCVVLTGMGQDGLRGARAVHDAGGRVLVQSGPTCVIWGMPKAVEEAGIAEAVVPLSELSAAILKRIGSGLLPLRNPPPEKGG